MLPQQLLSRPNVWQAREMEAEVECWPFLSTRSRPTETCFKAFDSTLNSLFVVKGQTFDRLGLSLASARARGCLFPNTSWRHFGEEYAAC